MVLNQAYLFLVFILNGVAIGILFDFFRILRKSFKTSNLVTYIEDAIFWILTGFSILYCIFVFNNGEIRMYMFVGIAIGLISYILLLSSYFIKINVDIINVLKKIILRIFSFIILPFSYLYKLMRKLLLKPIYFVFINLSKTLTRFYNNFRQMIKTNKKIKNNSKKIKI